MNTKWYFHLTLSLKSDFLLDDQQFNDHYLVYHFPTLKPLKVSVRINGLLEADHNTVAFGEVLHGVLGVTEAPSMMAVNDMNSNSQEAEDDR